MVVAARWPPNLDLTCDNDVNVAGLPGGPGIAQLPAIGAEQLSAEGDPRTIAVKELGAVVWYRGELRVVLTTSSAAPALILDVQVAIYDRQQISPMWGLELDPPCGGPSLHRLFRTVLDYGSTEDLGVVGADMGYGHDVKAVPAQPLGRTFTVSHNDPAELVFHVYACSGYYEWGLKITYMAAGQTRTKFVGTQTEPLKAIGGWRDVDRYHGLYEGAITTIQPGPSTSPTQGPPTSAAPICPSR